MSNNINNKSAKDIASIGNFTKHAVQSFENGIVNEHNFLEKVDNNLKNNKTN